MKQLLMGLFLLSSFSAMALTPPPSQHCKNKLARMAKNLEREHIKELDLERKEHKEQMETFTSFGGNSERFETTYVTVEFYNGTARYMFRGSFDRYNCLVTGVERRVD